MFGEFIIRFRWGLVTLLLTVLVGAISLLPAIEVNQNFDDSFPDKDPDLEFYRNMTAELGDEDDLLMLAVHRKNGIFDSVFLAKFHAFTLAAGNLPQVVASRSLTTLNDVRRTPFGILPTPFLHLDNPSLFNADSLRLLNDERLLGRFVSTDLKTLTVILELEKQMDPNTGEALITSLENLGQKFEYREMYIMGRKYFEVSHNRISQKELKKGVIICIGLIIVLLGFIYRSFWGIMLPVMVYVFSLLLFLAYHVIRGQPLDVLTIMAPTILLIVSVSDVIHFLSKYEDQLKAGLEKRAALISTLNSIGLAIFLTSFTTAIGFITLLTSSLPTLRKFGGGIAAGVILAYLITIILVPFVLYYISENAIHIRTDWHQWWHRMANRIFYIVKNKSKWIIQTAIFLCLIGILGITQINTNNFFVGSLPKNHASTKAVAFFEKNLSGIRTFEIALEPKEGILLNKLALLTEIEKLHQHIDALPQTGGVYSPVSIYKSFNQAWHAGQPRAYVLAESQEEITRQEQKFEQSSGNVFHRIMNKEKTLGKVSARMSDLGRQHVYALNEEVDSWIRSHLDTSLLKTRIIGSSAMVDKIQEHAIRNMFTGLSLSFAAIGVLIFLFYRSWRMVVIVLTINLLPLILTAALMALLKIELVFITSVIFTIGFVISVDDTIHFISRYQMERAKGAAAQDAISCTLQKTGRAMLLTSAVLFLGFAQLITSSFRDAQATGIMVSVMLFFALIVDLFLGPLLILKLAKFKVR